MGKKVKHRLRKELLYYAALAVLAGARLVPFPLLYYTGACLGWCSYYVLRRERRKTLANLELALGKEKPPGERRRIAREVFVNLGRNMVELAFYPRIDGDNIGAFVKMEGREIVDRELGKGKGVIIITGHIGNWELIPTYFCAVGYRGGVVARRAYYEKYNRLLERLRRSKGFRVFYRDKSPKEILKTLRNNELVGVLADQDVRKLPGVFVEFFGRSAYTPAGPVLIAMKSGAPLVPVRIVREGRGHRIIVDEPIRLRDSGDRRADLVYNTELWSCRIEEYVRARPGQWVWMHRRWRTRPGDVSMERKA